VPWESSKETHSSEKREQKYRFQLIKCLPSPVGQIRSSIKGNGNAIENGNGNRNAMRRTISAFRNLKAPIFGSKGRDGAQVINAPTEELHPHP